MLTYAGGGGLVRLLHATQHTSAHVRPMLTYADVCWRRGSVRRLHATSHRPHHTPVCASTRAHLLCVFPNLREASSFFTPSLYCALFFPPRSLVALFVVGFSIVSSRITRKFRIPSSRTFSIRQHTSAYVSITRKFRMPSSRRLQCQKDASG